MNSVKTQVSGVDTDDGKLILDDHKLSYHFDRFQRWLNGDKIAPVSVDMALTRSCGAMCQFCYAMVQEPQERLAIKTVDALNLLDDFAEIGVKGVSLISDGESSLSPAYVPFIKHAADIGIDVGNATNAWAWGKDKVDEILPDLTWVRFTVAAGSPERYSEIMYKSSEETQVFDNAMKNIKYAVELKKKLGLEVTLGIQMVLMPEFKDEIVPFAKLGVDLGVDYAVIKHCSDDTEGSLGVDYTKYEALTDLLLEAESMSNEKTKVIVKWSKIEEGNDCTYTAMYGPQFLLQISGSGLVAPSGMFFNAKYSKLHIGNFTEERFIDIFNSKEYDRVMNYITSERFDAKTMMGSLPIQHYLNKSIDNHRKGVELIKPMDIEKERPMHVNFL